jgi:hypothetical protein
VTEPQRFFFVHLQKTGGTALFQRLRDHFGTRAVYPTPDIQGTPQAVLDVEFLAERFARQRDELRVITGHFPLCTTEVLGVPFTTFTLLRDPVERTLSFLRHQRQVDAGLAEAPLQVIYSDPSRQEGLLRNHMVKMLSLSVGEMTKGVLTPVDFDRERLMAAEANLARAVDVVGFQERFDDMCDELARRFGWDLGRPRFANRTFDHPEVSEEFRQRIASDNALDVELYEHAVRRFGGAP